MCIEDKRSLSGTPAGGIFTVVTGPGTISGNTLTAYGEGSINIKFTYNDKCSNSAPQSIYVNSKPVADAGPDQVLEFTFETTMAAELMPQQRGEWSLVSGSGKIADNKSPVTKITDLAAGENRFRWTVYSGTCVAYDEIIIKVNDLFIPTVITPNGDGKNDYFKINVTTEKIELTVINRWGITEYRNSNYKNDWDGKNDKGDDLKEDTYFIILNFERGMTRKSTVLIMR
jgi:gliding motility-associated-like protein